MCKARACHSEQPLTASINCSTHALAICSSLCFGVLLLADRATRPLPRFDSGYYGECVPPWTRQSGLVMLKSHLRLLPQLWMDPSDWLFLSGLLSRPRSHFHHRRFTKGALVM